MNKRFRRRKIKALLKISSKDESLIDESFFYEGLDEAEYYEDIHGDYYPDISKEKIDYEKSQGNVFYGRNINWIGTKGSMVRVPVNNIYPVEGNNFDMKKMKGLQQKIEYSEDKVFLYAPYVMISKVSPSTIRETVLNDSSINLSTGDENLDEYLKDEDSWMHENLNMWEFPQGIIEGSETSEKILELEDRRIDLESEDELDEFDKEELDKINKAQPYIDKIKEMESKFENLKDDPGGDVGELIYQVRDGNHRAFVAKYIGEEYIWCFVEENQLNDIINSPDRYKDYGIEIY